MSDRPASTAHVVPFVHDSGGDKGLYFSIREIQSRMQVGDPDALDLGYTRTMMGFLLFQPEPRQIAMIGLGGGSLAKFCHRYLPQAQIQVAEINPHVIALRNEFCVPANSERFSVLRADGALFVRHSVTPRDVLLVDGFDDQGQPARLCSQRFYDDCSAMLQPGGVLVVNLHLGHPRYEIFLDRIRRSFGDILIVNDGERSNSVVFAIRAPDLEAYRRAPLRRPAKLDSAAATQLHSAFALVRAALKTAPQSLTR